MGSLFCLWLENNFIAGLSTRYLRKNWNRGLLTSKNYDMLKMFVTGIEMQRVTNEEVEL